MLANYHTHTPRCRHAVGTEEEYVRCAIDRGLEILGFSDHSPYTFPKSFFSDYRMGLEELDDYVEAVTGLQKKYTGQLRIPLGLELEYYPAYLPELLEILRDKPIDYAILGQHFVGNEIGEHYSGYKTEDETILRRYCDQAIEGMETGLFSYLAHPDLIYYTGDVKCYQRHMRRLCKGANSCKLPIELNLCGLKEKRNYPNPCFWEMAAEQNCKVVLGYDAHNPKFLLDTDLEREALDFLKPYGLELLETVSLRPIGG